MQRRHHLRSRFHFQRLRSEGQSLSTSRLLVRVAPNALPYNRYGFIVSKRVGKAVARNRLRRRLREAMRSIHHRLAGGYDVVVIARPHSLDSTYQELCDALTRLLRQAALVMD